MCHAITEKETFQIKRIARPLGKYMHFIFRNSNASTGMWSGIKMKNCIGQDVREVKEGRIM